MFHKQLTIEFFESMGIADTGGSQLVVARLPSAIVESFPTRPIPGAHAAGDERGTVVNFSPRDEPNWVVMTRHRGVPTGANHVHPARSHGQKRPHQGHYLVAINRPLLYIRKADVVVGTVVLPGEVVHTPPDAAHRTDFVTFGKQPHLHGAFFPAGGMTSDHKQNTLAITPEVEQELAGYAESKGLIGVQVSAELADQSFGLPQSNASRRQQERWRERFSAERGIPVPRIRNLPHMPFDPLLS